MGNSARASILTMIDVCPRNLTVRYDGKVNSVIISTFAPSAVPDILYQRVVRLHQLLHLNVDPQRWSG